jgi:5'-3' exonuclease
MVEFEADDALAAGAVAAARENKVERIFICTPDKDLGQSVQGKRIVQMHRRTGIVLDEAGIVEKFGVSPASIPDYLGLVGDSADGYPGIKGWGAKSSAAVLSKFGKLEQIPKGWQQWGVKVNGATRLAETLVNNWELALLFRRLATLRTDITLFEDVEELRWRGPTPEFEQIGKELDSAKISQRQPPR